MYVCTHCTTRSRVANLAEREEKVATKLFSAILSLTALLVVNQTHLMNLSYHRIFLRKEGEVFKLLSFKT